MSGRLGLAKSGLKVGIGVLISLLGVNLRRMMELAMIGMAPTVLRIVLASHKDTDPQQDL